MLGNRESIPVREQREKTEREEFDFREEKKKQRGERRSWG